MQYEVPQFETETNIFGPFSLVQFIVAAVVGISIIFLWNVLEMWLWLLTAILLGGGTMAFLFVKVRGRGMMIFIPTALNYFWQPKKYVYKKPSAVVVGLKNINVPTGVKPISVKPEHLKTRTAEPEMISPYVVTQLGVTEQRERKSVIITPKVTQIEPKKDVPLLRDLMNRITTTTAPIPQRETSVKKIELTQKEGEYEVLENIMGEKETAKRIDYRA